MSTNLIERLSAVIATGEVSRSGLARAAGLHPNSLRKLGRPTGTRPPTRLVRLERLLQQRQYGQLLVGAEAIIDEARNGRMFILVDDDDRENEGDLVIPAQMATPDAINFMARHGRGLICLALARSASMRSGCNRWPATTAAATKPPSPSRSRRARGSRPAYQRRRPGADHRGGDRLQQRPDALVSPGHVFPLVARPGGVLVRAGHTEAAVDVARLAGTQPVGRDLRDHARGRDHGPARRSDELRRATTASRSARSAI